MMSICIQRGSTALESGSVNTFRRCSSSSPHIVFLSVNRRILYTFYLDPEPATPDGSYQESNSTEYGTVMFWTLTVPVCSVKALIARKNRKDCSCSWQT